jgi:hypothetical protein
METHPISLPLSLPHTHARTHTPLWHAMGQLYLNLDILTLIHLNDSMLQYTVFSHHPDLVDDIIYKVNSHSKIHCKVTNKYNQQNASTEIYFSMLVSNSPCLNFSALYSVICSKELHVNDKNNLPTEHCRCVHKIF